MLIKLPGYFKFTIIIFGFTLLIHAMIGAQTLLLPLFWSLFIALMIHPISSWLERKGWKKILAIIVSMAAVLLILGSIFYFLSSQVIGLIADLPELSQKLVKYYDTIVCSLAENIGYNYQSERDGLEQTLGNVIQNSSGYLQDTLSSTAKTIAMMGIMPVYIFLMLLYKDFFIQFLKMAYHGKNPGKVLSLVEKASKVVQNYLSGMMWVTLFVAVLVAVVFFALGIKYALFFALFVAIFNLIPYIGVFIASFVSVLYVILTKDSLLLPVLTLLLLWVVQLIENNLITPYVVGSKVNINPLVVVMAVIAGGLIWGVSGMILFIPLIGALKVIFDEIESLRPYGFLLGDIKGDSDDKLPNSSD